MKKLKIMFQGGTSFDINLKDEDYSGRSGSFHDKYTRRRLRRDVGHSEYIDAKTNKKVMFYVSDIVAIEIESIEEKKEEEDKKTEKKENKKEEKKAGGNVSETPPVIRKGKKAQ